MVLFNKSEKEEGGCNMENNKASKICKVMAILVKNNEFKDKAISYCQGIKNQVVYQTIRNKN